MRITKTVLLGCCCLTFLVAFHRRAPAAESPVVSSPLDTAASLAQLRLAPGMRIELAASEPQVVDPVAIRFDAGGRMWVVEMRDYPNGPAKNQPPMSRIKVLEDRDQDGRFETATVFADKLLFATGIQPWRDGVIATIAGEVIFLRDTDGDDVADKRETWFRGFAEDNPQLRANHPTLAIDNRIYIANGLRGGTVLSVKEPGSTPVSISGKDFRFDPRTHVPEAVTGAGQFGLTFDDHGHRFVCSNRNPLKQIVLEDRYLTRNALAAVPSAVHDVAVAGAASRIYPVSRAWTTSNLHAGQFTAACGATIYRGDALPALRGDAFTCDPTGNLVHREILQPTGATFEGKAARVGVEFLASPDEWFRPVNLESGPDGALYVVDMYRAVIEHPQWVPEELKHRPDERHGDDRGRIYRIVSTEPIARQADDPAAPSLEEQKTGQLVETLTHRNLWHRETAARLLIERNDPTAAPLLKALVRHDYPPAAMRAIWLLKSANALDEETLRLGFEHADPDVRSQAIVAWDETARNSAELRGRVRQLCADEDAGVRMRALLCLAPINASEAVDVARAAATGADVWVAQALTIAAGTHPARVLQTVIDRSGKQSMSWQLVSDLAALGASQPEADERMRTLQAILSVPTDQRTLAQPALSRFCDALRRRGRTLDDVQQQLTDTQQETLASLFADAQRVLHDPATPLGQRLASLALVTHSPAAATTLRTLIAPTQPQSLRVAGIAALARFPAKDVWQQLARSFERESPAIRRATVNALLGNAERTRLLLEEVARGRIKPGELDRSQSNRLLKHSDAKIRARANKLFADAIPGDRKKVLADYQVVLTMKADPMRGQLVFKKNCATCHRIGETGVNVAPDISDSRTKQPVQILTDILQPNRAIDNNYLSYSLITTDGRVLTGILTAETASSVTLQQAENKTETLLRDEIETLKSNGVSLMPEGLEKTISHRQMADLVSFIKNWRYLDGKTPLGKPLTEK